MFRYNLPVRSALVLAAVVASGCVLPFGSAAPQPATTAGKNRFTLGGRAELPTVDLLETREEDDGDVALTPFPVTSIELGYGIHDSIDLEVGLDFAIFFVVPAPLGGFGGIRVQTYRSDFVAVTTAARLGYVGMSNDSDDDIEDRTVSAVYGTANISMQINHQGWVSPGLSVGYTGASVKDDPADGPAIRDFTSLANATFYVDLTRGEGHFGPFANAILIHDERTDDEVVVTGGLFFYARFGAGGQPAPSAPPGSL
jgi:hypothetical protein